MTTGKYYRNPSDRQSNAIYLSRRLGKRLARQSPDVAEDYKSGITLTALAEQYLPKIHNISESVAMNAVYYALDDLLEDGERKSISKQHMLAGSRKAGKITGPIYGKRNYEKGIGLATLTHEDLYAQGRRSAIARGQALYDTEKKQTEFGEVFEKDYVLELKKLGTPWNIIAEKTNKLFGNNRSYQTLKTLHNKKWIKEKI